MKPASTSRALQLPIQRDDDLQELRPGEADGLSLDEWRRRFGEPDGSLPTHLFRPFSPGGESWAGFLVRAGGAWPASSPNMRTRRWWRCHGGVLEVSFHPAWFGRNRHRVAFAPLNTSITHWRHRRESHGQSEWTLVTFNDAGHLAGAGVPEESLWEAVPTPPNED